MKLRYLISISIAIKLVFILITYHPDTHFFVLANYITIIKSQWLSFYDFLGNSTDPVSNVLPPYAFTYPPLAILTNAIVAFPLYQLIPTEFITNFLINPPSQLGTPFYFLLILATKVGYLIPDLLIAYYLGKILVAKYRRRIILLWLFNPITLYSAYGVGAFDLYPVLFIVMAYYFYNQNKIISSALCLGLGGAFKLFPLLLLPILVFSHSNLKTKSISLISGLMGYLIPVIPYLIISPGFRTYALLAPQTDKMLFAKIPLTGAEYLSIYILFITFISIYSIYHNRLLSGWTSILLGFFAVTHFHPQWLIWVIPLLILNLLRYPDLKYLYIIFFMIYTIIVFSFESSLNYGLLIFFNNAPSIVDLIPASLDYHKYLSISRSVFAGIILYIIYYLFTNKPNDIVAIKK